jgi:hypothetical protein
MSEGILTLLVSSILALILFVLTLWYQNRSKAREKVIETEIIQTELISPEISGLIPVYTNIKRSRVSISSGYKYIINAKNIGLGEIEKPEFDISFDTNANIHKVKVDSKYLTPDKIELPSGIQRPNYCRVIPQYMNKGHTLTIAVTTINNEIKNCNIDVRGAGILHRKKTFNPTWIVVAIIFFITLIALLNRFLVI